MYGGKLINKDIETSISDNRGKGAKILATGSSSCIFQPNIPCANSKDSVDNTKISKIVYGSKSDKYLEQEKKINGLVKKIKGYNDWALIYDKFCKAPLYGNILKNYDKDIVKCMEKYYEGKFNETNNMMVGMYGGDTFEDHFVQKVLNNQKNIDKSMYILLLKMEPLFLGLNELYKNNISHLDIKVNNIVLHKNVFKYIDFGLSSELNDYTHFKNRSLSELNNRRYYLWYPVEYIYSHSPKHESPEELLKITKRKHYDKGVKIYKLLGYDFKGVAEHSLKNDLKRNYKQLYSMIDVFSLGIMIPYLFIDYNQSKFIKNSPFLTELFNLFSRMCDPDHNKRIEPEECLVLYNSLITKFSTLKRTTKSKPTVKSKKKSKKKSSKKKSPPKKFEKFI